MSTDPVADDLLPAPPEAATVEALLASPDVDDVAVGRWQIDNDGAAEWALHRLAVNRATLKQLEAQRSDWHERVEEWFKTASRAPRRAAEWFDTQLQFFGMDRREQSPRDSKGQPTVKTVALVTGAIATTGHQEKIVVANDAAVLEWAENLAVLLDEPPTDGSDWLTVEEGGILKYAVTAADVGIIKVTKSIMVAALRQHVQIIDGAQFDPPAQCHSCGSTDGVYSDDEVDQQWTCGSCGDEWPVQRNARRVVVGPDQLPVPGVTVEPAYVTAKVTTNT